MDSNLLGRQSFVSVALIKQLPRLVNCHPAHGGAGLEWLVIETDKTGLKSLLDCFVPRTRFL